MPEKRVIVKRTFVDDDVRQVIYFLRGIDEANPIIRFHRDGSVARGTYINGRVENLTPVKIERLGAMEQDAFNLPKTELEKKYPNIEVSDLRLSKDSNSPALFELY